jgi:Ser/Thr protein kinase RdoA (MazF antagonist)
MTGSRAAQQAGGALVSLALHRLAGAWRQPVLAGRVLAATPGHAVFRAIAPDGREVVVKADMPPGRSAAEHRVTAAAGAAGLPVPPILHADKGGQGGPALLVLAFVPGVPLSPAAPGPAWADAGRVLARLHALPPPRPLPVSLDWRLNWGPGELAATRPAGNGRPRPEPGLAGLAIREAADAADRGLVSARLAARIGRQLAAALGAATLDTTVPGTTVPGSRRRLLHGDCQPAHFLLTGQAVAALIDFGETALGDPVWDLAVLTLDNPARLGDVLAGYAPEPGLRRHIHRRIGPYRLLRCLAEANWLHQFGFDPAVNVAALHTVGDGAVPPDWPGTSWPTAGSGTAG